MTDFRETSQVVKLFEDLPQDRQILFHLNDSKVNYLAKVDRHQPLGYGTIWSEKQDSLIRFAELAQQTSRDIILETPTAALTEMGWLRSID
jgi:endonuclease IV